MTKGSRLAMATLLALAMLAPLAPGARGAQCGSGPAGFEAWKAEFAREAGAKGIGATAVAALMQTHYAGATIAADRGQRSFGLSLDQFLAKRGAYPQLQSAGRVRAIPNPALIGPPPHSPSICLPMIAIAF